MPKNWRKGVTGHKMTFEQRTKISESLKGNKNHLGKKHSKESKEKMSLARKSQTYTEDRKRRMSETHKRIGSYKRLTRYGSEHGNWKGGITPVNEKIRKSLEYKMWRKSVFERDNYTCVWCGYQTGYGLTIRLNADHIKPFALFPELRFAIDNGRTLCEPCHKTTDTYAGRTKVK